MSGVRRYEGGRLVGGDQPVPIPSVAWTAVKAEPPVRPARPTERCQDRGRTAKGQWAERPSKFGFDKLKVGDTALVPDIDGLPRWILQRRISGSAVYHHKRTGMVIRTGMVEGGVEIERLA